ncbi:MAG: corrinoid protein, partial [Desulfobacterales bacterium]
VKNALALIGKGMDAGTVLNDGMIPAMEQIGERFKTGDVFIPEVLLSARAMNRAMAELEPLFAATRKRASAKVLIGTVQGDMHDIGKNMVSIMLRGVGFDVRDIGINVITEEFLHQVNVFKPDILALSALLTTTMPEMKTIIDALKAEGLRDKVKILVGGAPVNKRYAEEIGADGYAKDAGEAVAVAKEILFWGKSEC